MNNNQQPTAEIIEWVKDIPLYQQSIERNIFPILEKMEIARDFPNNWMTPRLADALATGAAEYVLSTGTHHPRMQIIRPPYFLLHSYYRLWSEHPEISFTWQQGCQRVSLTTVLATEHVARVNAKKAGVTALAIAQREARRLDARTLYLNQTLDPACWTRADVEQMLADIETVRQAHPQRLYHLDCSSYHLAHFVQKIAAWGLERDFAKPASIIHAYEYTPRNVKRRLLEWFDCPIVDLFGSTELGYLFYSDREGRYTPYLDKMHIELVPFALDRPIHSLIVSSIRNPYMPLVRYRSGDCVQTADGSLDPAQITRFCGREKEMLTTPRGVFSQADIDDLLSAASAQIFVYHLQPDAPQRMQLRYTTWDGQPVAARVAAGLRDALLEVTGLQVSLDHCTHLPIGQSGKYPWLSKSALALSSEPA